MARAPSFQFYPSDWLNDVKLQSCSMAAQGLLINLMCLMHQSERYGYLLVNGLNPGSTLVQHLLRVDTKLFNRCIRELLRNGVLRQDEDGVLYCKRMVEDQALRDKRAACGRLGGNPNLVNQKDKHRVNQASNQKPTPSSSSSSSSSSSVKQTSLRDVSSERSPDPSEPPPVSPVFIEAPVVGKDGGMTALTESDIDEWIRLFPGIDVRQSVRACVAWNLANPTRRKTRAGFKRHVTSWLTRDQERNGGKHQQATSGDPYRLIMEKYGNGEEDS